MGIFETQIKPLLDGGDYFGDIPSQLLVNSANEIGTKLSEAGLKNHQLRKFYDTVKQIERLALNKKVDEELPKELVAQLIFLRPHLANAQRKVDSIQQLREALDVCLSPDVIEKKADLTRFVKFFEAIVAYAK